MASWPQSHSTTIRHISRRKLVSSVARTGSSRFRAICPQILVEPLKLLLLAFLFVMSRLMPDMQGEPSGRIVAWRSSRASAPRRLDTTDIRPVVAHAPLQADGQRALMSGDRGAGRQSTRAYNGGSSLGSRRSAVIIAPPDRLIRQRRYCRPPRGRRSGDVTSPRSRAAPVRRVCDLRCREGSSKFP